MTDPRKEFEERLLALVREELDIMDDANPHGYSIGAFGVVYQVQHREPRGDGEESSYDRQPFPRSYVTACWAADPWEQQAMIEEVGRDVIAARKAHFRSFRKQDDA